MRYSELAASRMVDRPGRPLIGKAPWGHWKTTTFVAGGRHNRISAPFVLQGAMNGQSFLTYLETILISIAQSDEEPPTSRPNARATTRRVRPVQSGSIIASVSGSSFRSYFLPSEA